MIVGALDRIVFAAVRSTRCNAQAGEAFDPPPYGLGRTARRLGDVWQEQRHLSIVGLVYAFFYCVLSLAIPLLIATAIDSSIVEHTYPLAPLLVAIGVLSVIRAWVNVQRRYATSRVGINIEARLRELCTRRICGTRGLFLTASRPARCSRGRPTTCTRCGTSSAGAWFRRCRAAC